MGLTSGGLLAVLVLASALAVGAAVWLWPHLAGGGLRVVAARALLLCGGQLALVLTLLVWANSYFLWFGSWDELLGAQPAMVDGMARGGAFSGSGSAHGALPPSRMASRLWPRAYQDDPGRYGRLDDVRLPGAATGFAQQALVLLPPEYFQPQYAHRLFPVALMLTGYPGSTRSLVLRLDLPGWVAKGRAAGELQPTIYVMMEPTVVPPRDTECTNVPGGPQVATYFAQDVPVAVGRLYRTAPSRDGWGIMGDSTGGYCAAKIAMLYSDRYGSGVNMAGDFTAIKDGTTHDLYGHSRAVRSANDLLWREAHLPAPPVHILVTSSRNGERSYPQAIRFIDGARAPMDVDEVILATGGHNYTTWARVFPAVLAWMSSHERVA